jgi:hypothetical protein
MNNVYTGRKVYDVTNYLEDHPGGSEVMIEFAGIIISHFELNIIIVVNILYSSK